MISWGTILYGALLFTGLPAAVALTGERRSKVIVAGAMCALAGPVAWNAILRATHADTFFTDAPVAVMPASWQDTGSGVFAVAMTAVLLGLGPLGGGPARRTVAYALLAGLAALLVDVYLY